MADLVRLEPRLLLAGGLQGVGLPPVANDDAAKTAEDTAVLIDVAANDTDPDGSVDLTTVALVSPPANASAAVDPATGAVTYTPAKDFFGSDTFTYTVQDNDLNSSSAATVTVTVTPVDDPPTAQGDAYSTDEEAVLTVAAADGVLANDVEPDGEPLRATLVSGPASGAVTFHEDGSFEYVPAVNFNGADTFTYSASDVRAAGDSIVASGQPPLHLTPWVTPGEVASGQAQIQWSGGQPDMRLNLWAVGPVGWAKIATDVAASDGLYAWDTTRVLVGRYTFAADVYIAAHSPATVTVTVRAVNDAPVAQGDAYDTDEDTTLTVDAADGVLANDNDLDGDTLTAVLVSGTSNGTLTFHEDGSFEYVPAGNFYGTDGFAYVATDGLPVAASGVTVPVQSPLDLTPWATPAQVASGQVQIEWTGGQIGTRLDLWAAGPLGWMLAAEDIPAVAGSYNWDTTGLPAGWYCFVAEVYAVGLSPGTVTLTVHPVNDVPVAVDDVATTDEDTPVSGNVLANDSDVDIGDTLTVTGVDSAGTTGLATCGTDGTFTYDPNGQFEHLAVGQTATDSFDYTISDGNGGTDSATVTVTITGVNDAPVAADDTATTDEDVPVTIDVVANDTDIDGTVDPATVAVTQAPAHGDVVVHGDGTVTYTPAAAFFGTDSFRYTVQDNAGGTSNAALVSVEVQEVPDTLQIVDITINDGGAQRSNIERLTIRFNKDTNLQRLIDDGSIVDAIGLFGDTQVALTPGRFHYDAGTLTLTIDLTAAGLGQPGWTMLTDGTHQLRFDTRRISTKDIAGDHLIDDDGLVDGFRRFDFYRLEGDFDGNAVVDLVDRDMFTPHLGAAVGDEGYDRIYDLTGGGVIDVSDYFRFTRLVGNTV